MGVVGRPHGVRGLVRVHSFTADPADLARYGALVDEQGRRWRLAWKGADGVAELRDAAGVRLADRTAAEALTNLRLYVERERLPAAEDDEFYLADLIGLRVVGVGGGAIGLVALVHDYGAGASLEITREGAGALIVPFTRACVPVVDLAAGVVTVDPPDEVAGEAAAA